MEIVLPVPIPAPTDLSSLTLVDSVTTATSKIITITQSGWYVGAVRASLATKGFGGSNPGNSGCISDSLFYLYAGSKVLLWGASSTATGYPVPTGSGGGWKTNGYNGLLGGGGSCGRDESGTGGGGAGGHGGSPVYSGSGRGGSGCGIIAGINSNVVNNLEYLTLESWSVGSFSVANVEAMVLCGGGGGGTGDEGDLRSGGGGGGAWGSGGGSYSGWIGGTGPGTGDIHYPSGEYGARYGAGGDGIWGIRDFTRDRTEFGWGIKPSSSATAGSAKLYWVNNQIVMPTYFWDLGLVTDTVGVNSMDNGLITDSVTLTKDMGTLVA